MDEDLTLDPIKAKKDPTDTRLAGAVYLYLLKDEADPLGALKEFLLESFEPLGPADAPGLNLDESADNHYYLTQPETNRRLDVHIRTTDNIIVVSLVEFGPGDDPGWTQPFLNSCRTHLAERGINVLGTDLVLVTDDEPGQLLGQLGQVVGPRHTHISAVLQGQVLHQLIGRDQQQYFVLETRSATSVHDFIAKELPRLSWAIQRMRRETTFFNDRIRTILAEKNEIDKELSQIFHKKASCELTPEVMQVLEDQISRLSSMYSVLATNLHLVRDAINTLEKDLSQLSRQAESFDSAGDEGFPYFHVKHFRQYLKNLLKQESDIRLSLENTKAAIDLAQTQAQLIRGRQGLVWQDQTRELLNQNVTIQNERMSLQMAAEVIELVVIFYYSLKSWEAVAVKETVEALAPVIKFGVVALFSASVVGLAHYIGGSLHKKKLLAVPIGVTASLVALSLVLMAVLPGTVHK